MKFIVVFILAIWYTNSLSQENSFFSSLDSIDIDTKNIRVILTAADWCNICQANKSEFENSVQLQSFYSAYVSFYEVEENHSDTILFNGKTYSARQVDEKRSEHAFIYFLFGDKKVSYPTFFFINASNEIVYSYSGYLKENEMDQLLHSLLSKN